MFNLHIILYANAFWLVECANGKNACVKRTHGWNNRRAHFGYGLRNISHIWVRVCVCVACILHILLWGARILLLIFSESPSSRNAVFSYIKKNFFYADFFLTIPTCGWPFTRVCACVCFVESGNLTTARRRDDCGSVRWFFFCIFFFRLLFSIPHPCVWLYIILLCAYFRWKLFWAVARSHNLGAKYMRV